MQCYHNAASMMLATILNLNLNLNLPERSDGS